MVAGLVLLGGSLSSAGGAEQTVRVGILQNKPTVYWDQTGTPRGLYVDVINAIAEREGWTLEFVPGTWAEGLERLRDGSVDLMTSIAYTKERDQQFDFTSRNVLSIWGQIYLPKGSDVQTFLDLDDKSIAVLKGGISGQKFSALCREFSINCRIRPVASFDEVFRLVGEGSVDGGVVNNIYGYSHESGLPIDRSSIMFSPVGLRFATPAGGNAVLLSTIDEYLQRWNQYPESPYQRAVEATFGNIGQTGGIPEWLIPALVSILGAIAFVGGWGSVFYLRVQVWKKTEYLRREIEQKEQAERRLKESETRYRSLVEQAGDAILLSEFSTGQFVDVNNQACESYGYSREEFLSLFAQDINPTFSKEMREEFLKKMGDDAPVNTEVTHRRKDGTTFPVEIRARVVELDNRKLIVALARDVTECKRAEEKLKAAVRIADLGYWTWDVERDILDCSHEFNRLLGLEEESIENVTENFLKLVHPGDQEMVGKSIERTLNERAPYDIEYRVVRPVDGKIVWIHTVAEHVSGEGGVLAGISGTAQDITERKHMENQLRQAQKMEAVGQLTDGVAHEFNNLLQAIMGNIQMVRDIHEDDGGTTKLLDRALAASIRGGKLTQQLLSFSRKQILSPSVVNPNDLISDFSPLLQGTLGKAITLATTLADDLVTAKIDPGSFETAILNLAFNARSAMPKGGEVTIETANVDLREAIPHEDGELPIGKYAVVSFSDTGCGMSPEIVERAFEPFFTTRDVGHGIGLGLSMVYGFTTQSGGLSTIDSEPGKGTTVQLYLPAVAL